MGVARDGWACFGFGGAGPVRELGAKVKQRDGVRLAAAGGWYIDGRATRWARASVWGRAAMEQQQGK